MRTDRENEQRIAYNELVGDVICAADHTEIKNGKLPKTQQNQKNKLDLNKEAPPPLQISVVGDFKVLYKSK